MTGTDPDQHGAVVTRPLALQPAVRHGPWMAVRRAGRRALQALRPLAMPFLHRFEARVRTAVWGTGLVEDVSRLGVRSDEILAAVRSQAEQAEARASNDADSNQAQARDQAIADALARLETATARHGAQLEALGRVVPKLGTTVLRLEGAVAHEGKRLALIHQALCTSVVPLEPQVRQIGEQVALLVEARTEIADLKATLAGFAAEIGAIRTTVETSARHAALLVNRNSIALPGNAVAVRTISGYVIVPADDAELLVYLAEGGGHEPGTVKALEQLLDPGDLAIDVGAHVGLMAMPMARRVGPAGSVIAFEPSPRTAEMLRQTLGLNGLQDWTSVRQQAVSDYPSQAILHFGHNTALNSLLPLPDAGAGVEVAVVRLDDAIRAGTAVALVKIDVEGLELAVLAGMPGLVASNPGLVVIAEFALEHLARSGSTPAAWLGAFAKAGLDTALRIDEADGTCHAVTVDDLAAATGSVNLVLAGRAAPRLGRLRSAP